MSYLINKNDFKGRYRIAVSSFNTATFEEYLNQVEEQIITDDFGTDFYADVETNATKSKYQDLLDSGYKDYLLGACYFYYQRDNFLSTSSGNSQINNSNAVNVTSQFNSSLASDRYNLGVGYFNRGALDFLNDNAVKSELISSSTDLGGGLIRLDVLDVEYLYANDYVKINGLEYLVNAVDDVANTITITATGDFTGQKVIYLPFTEPYFEEKLLITQF